MKSSFYFLFFIALTLGSCDKDKVDDGVPDCDPFYGPVGSSETFIVRTDTFQTISPNSQLLYIDTAYSDNYDVYDCYSEYISTSSYGYLVQNLPGYPTSNSARFYDYGGAMQWPAVVDNYFDVTHIHALSDINPYGYELFLLLNVTRDSIAITCRDTSSSCSFQPIIAFKL